MLCKNCGQKMDNSAIYCEYCGVKIGKEDALQWVSKSEELNRYHELEYKIEDIKDEIAQLPSKKAHLQRILQSRDQKYKRLQMVRNVMIKEKKDYNSLLKWSFSSIKARMSGELDERKKKEQADYLDALANFHYVEVEYKSLDEEAKFVENEVKKIQGLKDHIPQIENEMESILAQITAGKTTTLLKELELKYEKIQKELLKTQDIEGKFRQADSYLIEAENLLRNSVNKLRSAERFGTWDAFFGGGFFADTLKHSDLNSARSDINMAQVLVRKAKDLVDVIDEIYIDFEAPNLFFDMFLDNFFFDMYGNTRITRTREHAEISLDKLNESRIILSNQLVEWVKQRNESIIEFNRLRKLVRDERLSLL
jgi:hypothetical protein